MASCDPDCAASTRSLLAPSIRTIIILHKAQGERETGEVSSGLLLLAFGTSYMPQWIRAGHVMEWQLLNITFTLQQACKGRGGEGRRGMTSNQLWNNTASATCNILKADVSHTMSTSQILNRSTSQILQISWIFQGNRIQYKVEKVVGYHVMVLSSIPDARAHTHRQTDRQTHTHTHTHHVNFRNFKWERLKILRYPRSSKEIGSNTKPRR